MQFRLFQRLRDLRKANQAWGAVKDTKEKIVSQKLVLGKGLLRSKTFWVNALTGVVAVLAAVGSISVVPVVAIPWLGAGLAIANVLLRLMTKEPITSVK